MIKYEGKITLGRQSMGLSGGKGEIMAEEYIIAYADKSVLKISGLNVKGMSTTQVEDLLSDKLKAYVRVIGVTGTSIEIPVGYAVQ